MPNPPRTTSPGRPAGLPHARPSARQLNDYRRQLRKRANEGDTVAIGLVILCETLRQQAGAEGEDRQ